MSKNKFWKFSNEVESDGSKLILEGPISDMTWWGDEVTPAEFRSELKEQKGDITVILNSGGGDVFAGLSIYNALREFDGNVTVRVDGLAASIASVIAMAGDKVIMSPGSMMMIHKPWTMAMGDVNELEKVKEILNGIEDSILPIYTSRSGLSKEEVTTMLEAETWFTAEQAVEKGFADELIEAKEKQSFSDAIKNTLTKDFALQMSATKKSMEDFAIKLSESEEVKEGEDVSKPTEGEESDVKTPNGVENSEVKTKEQENETEEVVTTEESKVNNVTDKEIKMSKEQEIAQTQVLEPKAQATVVEAPKLTVKQYLKSNDSMEAFARVLEDQAGKTSEDVKSAWKKHVETKLGVTNPEIFLPTTLITEIEDAFKQGGEIWNKVTKTGADVFRAAWDTQTDVDSEDGRGRGYVRSVDADKAEQSLTIADRVLRPQFVYKYITLNKEDVKNQRSSGALVRYVLTELPRRIVREIERAIVIGDGRAAGNAYKIDSFVAVKADTTAGNVFASTYTPAVGETRYASLLKARDEVESDGEIYLVAKKGYMTSMLLEENANGAFMFAPGTDLGRVLGFAGVIEPDWMTADTDNDAYLVTFANYKTVGDASIEAFTNFILKTNKQEYLQEIYAGGGLTVRKSAVAVAAVAS